MYFPCAIQLNVGPRSWDCVFEVHCYRGVNNINVVVGNEITMNPVKIGQPRPDFQPSAEKFKSILLSLREGDVRHWGFQYTDTFRDLFHES